MSSHVGSGVCIHSPYAPKNVGAGWPGAARLGGVVRSGILPVLANSSNHFGRMIPSGANWNIALRSIFSGDGRAAPPVATVREGPVGGDDQALGTGSASALHTLQEHVAAATQYIWKKTCGLAAATSSMDLLAKELSPMAVPPCCSRTGYRYFTVGGALPAHRSVKS